MLRQTPQASFGATPQHTSHEGIECQTLWLQPVTGKRRHQEQHCLAKMYHCQKVNPFSSAKLEASRL